MVKKTKWFFHGKNLIFQNSTVENFKNLEILQSKRFFQFSSGNNIWYIQASILKFFAYVLYWEDYRKTKNQIILGKFKNFNMEFGVNNMSWRSTAPSEFLFNILILIFYFNLMVCKLIGDLVKCHALFQRSFFAFLKTDQDQSKS